MNSELVKENVLFVSKDDYKAGVNKEKLMYVRNITSYVDLCMFVLDCLEDSTRETKPFNTLVVDEFDKLEGDEEEREKCIKLLNKWGNDLGFTTVFVVTNERI